MSTYTPDELNRLYNNRLLVPECMDILAKWTQESAAVRQSQRCHIDVPYGKADSHKLDIFPAAHDHHWHPWWCSFTAAIGAPWTRPINRF